MSRGAFDDLYRANAEFAAGFEDAGLPARAARGLAVLTCMDSRIHPFDMLGIGPVTPRSCATPVRASPRTSCARWCWRGHLLGVDRVMVMRTPAAGWPRPPRTRSRRCPPDSGLDTRSLEFRTTDDVRRALTTRPRLRSCPLPTDLASVDASSTSTGGRSPSSPRSTT